VLLEIDVHEVEMGEEEFVLAKHWLGLMGLDDSLRTLGRNISNDPPFGIAVLMEIWKV
jgi:hypothetical protein